MNKYMPEGALVSTIRNCEYISSKRGLEEAYEKGIILESEAILCDHNFNLHVDLGPKIRAIIPHNEVQYVKNNEEIKDIAVLTRVGKPVCFKIKGFEKSASGEEIVILSRRAAQMECALNYISDLVPGDIIPTKITHLENFGAFVDIGCGITSLLSIDSISVSRISHPSDRLSVGDRISAVVKTIDEENGRVFVSTKELLGSWLENAKEFEAGQTVLGIVRSVESYGVFIELAPNLAGLAEYREDVFPGQTAAVYIKSIIKDKMKIKLIIIDADDAHQPPSPLPYFIDPNEITHIDYWRYSPRVSSKIIETVF